MTEPFERRTVLTFNVLRPTCLQWSHSSLRWSHSSVGIIYLLDYRLLLNSFQKGGRNSPFTSRGVDGAGLFVDPFDSSFDFVTFTVTEGNNLTFGEDIAGRYSTGGYGLTRTFPYQLTTTVPAGQGVLTFLDAIVTD